MGEPLRVLAFSGSNRGASFNDRLVGVAADAAEGAGAAVTRLRLADLPIPLFSEDLEAESGMPENARVFKQHLIDHHAFLISCPEYNSSITPALKNALDWASRRQGEEASMIAYRGKVAGLLAASPGALGGLRGLVTVRSILSNIGVHVIPEQVAVSSAFEAFAEDGTLRDEGSARRVAGVVTSLVRTARALHALD